jgi:aldehyde dehydrogenase (NAD+)/betaine-aldehyde dehydrogenase
VTPADPPTLDLHTHLLIDGVLVAGQGQPLAVDNPATEQIIVTLSQASIEQVDQAVIAARRAFDSGACRNPDQRAAVLRRAADLLERQSQEFTSLLVQEIGTPISVCRSLQVDTPVKLLRFLADQTHLDRSRHLGRDSMPPVSESVIRYEPVGVVAGIGAYNNPLLYIASKCCAAYAVGCASVFLPSALTPLAALKFGEILLEAGLPPGALNIIVGDAGIGRALTAHPEVDMMQASAGIKDVVLELGGKSAGIVLPNSDLAHAAMSLHGRYIRNAGQGCQSPTRLLVPTANFDEFVDISRDVYGKIPVGDPWNPASVAGPLISKAHRARVEDYVQRALHAGGTLLAGGGRPNLERGWYMNAALIGGLSNDAELSRDELFAPVAVIIPYRNIDHAIAIANDSKLGLAASIFGPLDAAKSVAEKLQVGSVYINGGGNFRPDSVISGWKQSGVGAEWGEDGLREFLVPKHIQWMS